jgi:hypothetical protein
MEPEYARPKFLASYFDAMKERAHAKGWRGIIPVWLIIGFGAGAASSVCLPDALWTDTANWQVIVGLYATDVTINGLLLALSWGAFARIHELLVSSSEFAIFLRRAKLFNGYLFYIDWVQGAQLLALLVAGAAMFSSLVPSIPVIAHKMILATSIAFSIYAIRYAVNAVTMMHNLVWQRAVFEEQEQLHAGKVVGMSRGESDGAR